MYLGQKKITSSKTDGDYVIVTFEDDTTLKTSLEYLEFLQTEKSSDDLYLREQVFTANELFNALAKHNIMIERITPAFDRLIHSIDLNQKSKWKSYSGVEFEDRKMLDII